MKKLFLSIMAMTATLFMASCSEDDLSSGNQRNEAEVSFSLSLEGQLGTKSRSISDGKTVNRLTYAVFNADNGTQLPVWGTDGSGNANNHSESASEFTSGGTHNVEITLAKGQTYTVVFWADYSEASFPSPYTVSNDMKVSINYANMPNNLEKADAFFGSYTFNVIGNDSHTVTLTRPFAQLNVAVRDMDWNAAVASGITIGKSKVTVNSVGTSLNLRTGQVSGNEQVEFTLADIPSDSEKLHLASGIQFGSATENDFRYLSTTYLLVNDGTSAGDTRTTLTSAQFEFQPESGHPITLDGLNNIPVQRNWRTNIIGQLLTGNVTFTVQIDQSYIGDITNPAVVADINAANEAFSQGQTSVTIESIAEDGDIILPKTTSAASISLPETTSSVTVKYDDTAGQTEKPSVLNITIPESSVNSLNVIAPNTTVYVNGAVTTFTASTSPNTLVIGQGGSITKLKITKGNVVIEKGGAVANIARTGNDNTDTQTFVFVAKGVSVPSTTDDNIIFASYEAYGDYKVCYTAEGKSYYFQSVADACAYVHSIDNSATEISLFLTDDLSWNTGAAGDGANVMTPAPFTSVKIQGNHHTFTAEGAGGIMGDAGATVNFENVNFVDKTHYDYENGETAWEFTYLEFQGSKYIFENCTFQNTVMFSGNGISKINNCVFYGKATLQSNQPNEYAAWVTTSANFEGCTFASLYRGLKIANKYHTGNSGEYTVVIDGCTFTDISEKPGVVIDNKNFNNDIAAFSSITIKNSKFTNVQPGDQYNYIYETDNTHPTLENNTIVLTTAAGLKSLQTGTADKNSAGSYSGYLFELGADIDLSELEGDWEPIGQTGAGQFAGTFDGKNFTIHNLKINNTDESKNCSSGLFGWLMGKVLNVNVEGAEVKGHHNVGTIAGYMENGSIENCKVNNAKLSCTSVNDDANGDKCGGIIGYLNASSITNCTVTNSTIDAGRDAGQVVGYAQPASVTGCSATNVTVTANGTSTGANIRNEVIGRVP